MTGKRGHSQRFTISYIGAVFLHLYPLTLPLTMAHTYSSSENMAPSVRQEERSRQKSIDGAGISVHTLCERIRRHGTRQPLAGQGQNDLDIFRSHYLQSGADTSNNCLLSSFANLSKGMERESKSASGSKNHLINTDLLVPPQPAFLGGQNIRPRKVLGRHISSVSLHLQSQDMPSRMSFVHCQNSSSPIISSIMDSSETSGMFDQQEEPKRQTTPKNRSSIRTIGRRFFSRVIGSSSYEVVDHASGPSSWQGKGREQLTNIMSPYDSERSKMQASVTSGLRSRFDDGSLCKTMTKEYRNLSIPSLSFSCGTYSSSASDQSSSSLSPLTPAKLPCKPEESAEDPTDISAKRATAHRSTTASSFSQHEPQGNNHQVSYEKDYGGFEVASYKTYQDILPFSLTPSRLSDQSLGNPRRGASSIGPQQSHDRDERRKKRLPCSEDPIEESDTSDDEYGHENEEEQKLKPVGPLPPIRRHTTVISSIRSKMRTKVKSNEPRASIGEQRATTDSVPNHSYKDYKKPVSSVCLQKQRKEKDAEEDDLPLAVLLEKRSSRTLSAPTMASAHVSARLKQQQPLLLQQRRDSLDRQTAINRESEQLEYQRSLLKHARERRRKTQHPHVLTSPTYGAGEALLSPQHKSRAVRKSMVQSFHKDLREDVNTRRREVARPEITRPNYLMTRDQRPKAHSALSVPTLSSTCDGEDKSKPKRPKHPRHSSCSMLGGNIGSPKPQQAQMGPPRLTTLSGCPSAWGSPKTSQPSSTFSNRKSAPLIPQSMPFYSPVSAPALPYQSSISFPAMQNASFRYSMPMVAAPHFFYSQPQHPFQLQHHRSARSISNVACTPTALAV